jgi:hypothetical protein
MWFLFLWLQRRSTGPPALNALHRFQCCSVRIHCGDSWPCGLSCASPMSTPWNACSAGAPAHLPLVVVDSDAQCHYSPRRLRDRGTRHLYQHVRAVGSKLTWSRRWKAAAPPFAGDQPERSHCSKLCATTLSFDTHVLTVPLDRAPAPTSKCGTGAARPALENDFQERVTSSPALGNAGDVITHFWKYSHL